LHKGHFHPFLDARSGNNFELYPAPEPEDYLAATNSFLRVMLTATDTNGLTHTVSRDVQPRMVIINIHSDPEGKDVIVDEYSIQTPANVTSWVNFNMPLHVEDQSPYLFKTWSDGNTNRSRIVGLVQNVIHPTFTAIFCLDQDTLCSAHEDCCSGYCDANQCKPAPITQTPTASPQTFSLVDGSTSLTAPPSTFFIQPPFHSGTDESPPLEVDVDTPLESGEDGSIEYHGGTGSLSSIEATTVSKGTVEKKTTKNAWLVSLAIILVVVIVVWRWRRRRRLEKESDSVEFALDSFYGGLSVEMDAEDYVKAECVEGVAIIKPRGTGSTDGSERSRSNSSSSSSSTECRKNTGKQFENVTRPGSSDICFSADDQSAPSSLNEDIPANDLESQVYLNGVHHMSAECDSVGNEESTFSDMSSVERYPLSYELLPEKKHESSVKIADIEGIDCGERFRESSLCLAPNSSGLEVRGFTIINVSLIGCGGGGDREFFVRD
jgi:hypothetical protein